MCKDTQCWLEAGCGQLGVTRAHTELSIVVGAEARGGGGGCDEGTTEGFCEIPNRVDFPLCRIRESILNFISLYERSGCGH